MSNSVGGHSPADQELPDDVFIHPAAIVEAGATLGPRTRVWAFAHILPGAVIGEDVNVCDHVFIENDVVVGNRVTVKSGVQLWDGLRLEDDVFIGPNVTFTNDIFPRSKEYPEAFAQTIIRRGASIGANATLLPGIQVGRSAMVGAGAVVTENVPSNVIVAGNPAHITGYVDSQRFKGLRPTLIGSEESTVDLSGGSVVTLPLIPDMRGHLSVGEYDQHLPFIPKRYFLVFNVPSREVRGEHAHKTLHQFLVCVNGVCSVVLDDGKSRSEIVLDRPNIGVHVPPMVWATQYKYSQDAVLLVLASDVYDPDDYIRSYDEYLSLLAGEESSG